jgi:hypothetical protein
MDRNGFCVDGDHFRFGFLERKYCVHLFTHIKGLQRDLDNSSFNMDVRLDFMSCKVKAQGVLQRQRV